MMSTLHPKTKRPQEQAARNIVAALAGTIKKINLYSESHSVYHRALKDLMHQFDAYLGRFGSFRIHIQRNKITHNNETVYEGNSDPFDLAFLLHRDGILWLEFQHDLELYEIDSFFRILHDHILLTEKSEDDIVTALWELNLPSIAYEAADLHLDCQDEHLIFGARSSGNVQDGGVEKNAANLRSQDLYSDVGMLTLSGACTDDTWRLSIEERKRLREMIAAEEKLDGSDYVMDALLHILEEHPCEEDIEALLETLLVELHEILTNARFTYLLHTYMKLKKIATRHSRVKWIGTGLDTLFASLSCKSFLDGLLKISADVFNSNDAQLEDLKRFLVMLGPSAILGLGPIVRDIRLEALQRMIMDAIGFLAASDFGPLEKLIAESDTNLIIGIVPVLGGGNDWRSRQTLINLLRHPSERVRMQALKTFLIRDNQVINEIFPLIDDPDENIRTFVLKHLGRRRCSAAEAKLLEYLKANRPSDISRDHFFAVCRALGRCGSERSIPYLSQLLFKWPMMGILRPTGSPLRRGAVKALESLRINKAAMLIERHQRGFFGNVLRSMPQNFFGKESGEHQNVQ